MHHMLQHPYVARASRLGLASLLNRNGPTLCGPTPSVLQPQVASDPLRTLGHVSSHSLTGRMPNVLPRSRFASVAPTAPLSSTAQSPTDGSPPNPVAGPKDAQSGFLSKLFSSSSYSFDAKSSAELYDAAAAVTSATLSISPLFTSQATLPWSTLRLALDAFRVSVRRAEDYYGSQGAVGVLSAANYAQLLVGLGEVASRGRVRSLSDWAATDVPANREDVERLHAFAPIAHAAYQASAVDVSRACAAEGVDATVIHADPVGTADRAAFFILHRSVTPATRTSGSAAASVSAMQGSADEIVVTFRGTQSMGDLVTDLVSWPAPFLDSYAHEGMSRTAALLQPAVVSALAHHLPALMGFRRRDGAWERPSPSHPGQVQRFASSLELLADPSVALPRVVFTGHSLGAGVAMCMALAMRHHRLPAASTFADGDAQGADAAAEEQRLATLTETFAARLQPECVLFAAPACLSPRLSQRANDFTINAVCADDMVPRLSEFSMAHMLLQLHNIGKSRGASAPATAPAEGPSGADTAVGTPEASGQKGGWRLGTKMEAELKQLIGLYQKHVSERPSQPKQPRSKAPKKKKGASAADDDPAEASAGSAVATTEGGLIPVGATSKGKGNRTAKRIGELVGSVPTAVTGFVGSVPSAVTGLVGSVPSAVTGLVGSVPTAVSGLVGSVPTAVSSALKSEAVTSALKKPSEWASKLPASLRFKGRKPGAAETTMADANAEPLGLAAADAAAAGAIYTPLSRSSDAFSPEQAAIAPEEQTPSEAALRGLAARAQKAIEQYAAVIRANAAASATDELSDACMSSAPSAGDGTATASMAADPAAAKLSEGPVQLLSSAITRLVEASTLNPATRATTSSESGTALPQLAPPAHDDALVTTDSSAPPPPYRAPAPRSLTFNGAPLPVSASIPFRSAAGGTAVGADFLRAAAAEAAAARDAGMPLGSEEVTAMLDHPLVVDACGDGEAPRITLTDADAVDWDAQFLNGKYDPYAAADAASHVERKLEQVADVSVDKIAEAEEAAVRGVGSIVQKTRKAVADTQSATLAGISAAVSSASSRVESTTNDTSDRLRSLAQKASSLAQSSSTMPKPVRDALAQSAAALEGVAAEVVAASSSQKAALEKTAAEAADAVASVVASIDSSLTLSNDFVGQTASRTAEQLTSVVSATSHAAVETTSKARETAWRASVAQKQTAEKVMTNLDKAAHRTFEAQARSLLTALMSRSSSTSKAESIAAVEVTEAEATVETANGFLLVGPVEALSRPTRTPTEERIHALKDLREVDAFGKPLLTAERVSSSGLQILLTPSNVIYLKRMPPNGTPVSMASSTAIAKREKMRETRKNLIKEAIQASANPASITPTQDASEDSSNAAKDPNDVPLVGLDSFKVQWQAVKRSPYAFSEMIVSEAMLTDHLMKRYKTGLGAVLRRT